MRIESYASIWQRRLLPALCILAALLAPAGAWGQLPRYVVIFPAQITSGEYSGDYDIFSAGFSADGLIENNPLQPKAISAQNFKELRPVAISDMQGGFYMAYVIEHNDSAHMGDRDILIRHIDYNGTNLWGDSVNHIVAVAQSKYVEQNPRIALLEDGSLIVFYEVWYQSGDVDVAVVRLARDGTILWTKWGANSNRTERLGDVVADGRGGAIAVLEAKTYRDTILTASDVLAQRADSSGRLGWKDSEEPTIIAASPYLDQRPAAVSDGDGGAFVAYEVEYNKGERIGDVDIVAQHLTSYGSRAWTDEANPPIVSSNAKAKERSPVVVRDSTGLIVAFEVSFPVARGKGTANVIGMQRLDSLGRTSWNLGKKSKLIGVRNDIAERPQLITESVGGGAYLLFESRDTATSNRDIYAQRINRDGDQVWGDGELPIAIFNTTDSESNAVAAPDGLGGLVVVARKELSSEPVPGYSSIVVQRIALDGQQLWKDIMEVPLTLITAAYQSGAPVVVRK